MDPTDDEAMREELRRLREAGLRVPELDDMEVEEAVVETKPAIDPPITRSSGPWKVIAVVALLAALVAGLYVVRRTRADDLQAQNEQLRGQVDEAQAQLSVLQDQASNAQKQADALSLVLKQRERRFRLMSNACARLVNEYVLRSDRLGYAVNSYIFDGQSFEWLASFWEGEARGYQYSSYTARLDRSGCGMELRHPFKFPHDEVTPVAKDWIRGAQPPQFP